MRRYAVRRLTPEILPFDGGPPRRWAASIFVQRPSGCCLPPAMSSRPACMPGAARVDGVGVPTPRDPLARVVAPPAHLRVLAAAGDLHLAEHAFESVRITARAMPCAVASGTRQADLARRTTSCRPDT